VLFTVGSDGRDTFTAMNLLCVVNLASLEAINFEECLYVVHPMHSEKDVGSGSKGEFGCIMMSLFCALKIRKNE